MEHIVEMHQGQYTAKRLKEKKGLSETKTPP